MDKQIKLAIVGATGAVGGELLQVLEKRNFPAAELRLFASARSLGKKIFFRGSAIAVQELSEAALQGMDIVIFQRRAQGRQAVGPYQRFSREPR